MVKFLVVADSVLVLNDKDEAAWLESADVVVSVQRGRRFRKHSWVPACVHGGQRFDNIAVLCAANDAVKSGPRTKSHIDDVILTHMEQDLWTLTGSSENVIFVLMGDWSLWRHGFADTAEKNKAEFEYCLQQMEEAARRVPGVRVQRVVRPLHGLPLTRDKWHFTRDAIPTLRRVIFEDIFRHVVKGNTSHQSSDRLHLEENVAWVNVEDKARPRKDMEPVSKHRKIENLIARNDDVVDVDAGRRLRMEQLLTDSSSLTTLACFLPEGRTFPENQTAIPNEKYHAIFFFDTLTASKGRNAKTSLSGWRRWFDDHPQVWQALKKAVDSIDTETKPLLEPCAAAKLVRCKSWDRQHDEKPPKNFTHGASRSRSRSPPLTDAQLEIRQFRTQFRLDCVQLKAEWVKVRAELQCSLASLAKLAAEHLAGFSKLQHGRSSSL